MVTGKGCVDKTTVTATLVVGLMWRGHAVHPTTSAPVAHFRQTLAGQPGLNVRKTRKQALREQMNRVIPWAEWDKLMAPHRNKGKTGRPPFALESTLRSHFMQKQRKNKSCLRIFLLRKIHFLTTKIA